MIIDENEEEEDENAAATDVAGTAYRESMTSVDGFTRGANGKVKFNKDTKKRRREEAAQDVEMADAGAELPVASKPKKPKKKDEPRFGHEFKAKVRFRFLSVLGGADFPRRKQGGMLKRTGWTRTPTCRCRKRQRAPKRGKGSPADDDRTTRARLFTVLILRVSRVVVVVVVLSKYTSHDPCFAHFPTVSTD